MNASVTQATKIFVFCSIGCNPVLDGAASASAQNGLEADGANEEYTLMSIDTIINGKVIIDAWLFSRTSILVQWVAVLNNMLVDHFGPD